jgi:hypothetical protein
VLSDGTGHEHESALQGHVRHALQYSGEPVSSWTAFSRTAGEERHRYIIILTAVETCGDRKTGVSYEQAVTINGEDGVKRYYYIAEVTPLFVSDRLTGYRVHLQGHHGAEKQPAAA